MVVTAGGCSWHLVGKEARGAAQYPTMPRQAPTTEKYAAPNVGGAEVGKP